MVTQKVLSTIAGRNSGEHEFLDAVKEVGVSLQPVFKEHPNMIRIFEQICEPERQVIFRVAWLDDNNCLQVNRGFRIQFNSAIGPYKGGLRYHPTVNASIIKMLGFEQIFKNALTTLPLGGAKGGADFNPKGRSDGEIQRFCQSFMTELVRHIAEDMDVPAGDIGVGSREIGYLFGQYRRLSGRFQGAITGKELPYGGSLCRPEATGYGVVMLAEEMLKDQNDDIKGKRCAVSGSGNVALHCARMLVKSGAIVLAVSDSQGTLVEPEGFTQEQLRDIQKVKMDRKARLSECCTKSSKHFGDGQHPWTLEEIGDIDLAFPCATQGELDQDEVDSLAKKGCKAVIEGANMPTTAAGVERLHHHNILYVPGKMANAGGVAVSGLEMAQNRMMQAWTADEVYKKLKDIMKDIYTTAKKCAEQYSVDLSSGANIAAFLKVGEAVKAQGAV